MDVLEDGTDLVAPEEMSEETKTAMMESAMRRLCAAGMEGASPVIWSPLVVRLITRGLCDVPANGEEDELAEGRREALRQIIFDFVIADLQSRSVSSLDPALSILIRPTGWISLVCGSMRSGTSSKRVHRRKRCVLFPPVLKLS